MLGFAPKRALLAGLVCLGAVTGIAAGDPPAATPGQAPPAASQSSDEAAIDALLNQGKSELGQRVNEAGQEARTQLRNADRQYQETSDRITTLRNDAIVNTIVPEFVDGSVKGAHIGPGVAPTAPSPLEPRLPSMNTPGPISIAFEHSSNRSQGWARVISVPAGIDCPPTCSASFGEGVDVTIQATADPNSVIRVVECYAWTAGPTTQRLPGNTLDCGWPGLVAARGGRTVVLVDAVSPAGAVGVTGPGGATGSGPYGTPGGGGGVAGGSAGGTGGAGGTGTGSGSAGPGGAGSQTGSSGGATGTGAGACTMMTQYVSYKVKVASDGFVVGWLTNNSNQTIYVAYTFARGGKPYAPEAGGWTIRPGQTVGGEGGGIWAGGDVDTQPPEIFWYAALQSDVDQGKQCFPPW